jgi:putative acetyltransferase
VFLRRELLRDQSAVFALHAAAFARPGEATAPEAVLVEALRTDRDIIPELSIVAEQGGGIVGHVLCSRATVDGQPSLGLGPLGVHPDRQRRGVGHALMHAVLAAADALGAPAVFLLGDPAYYQRFGFDLAQRAGVQPPQPEWREHFQVRRLTTWTDSIRGTFRYAPAFTRL